MRGLLLVVFLLTCTCPPSWAAERRTGSDETARLQLMLQQLNAERTALAAENAKLERDLESSRTELEKVKSENAASRQKLGATSSQLATARAQGDAVQSAFDTLKSRFDELVEQFRKMAGALKEVEAERSSLERLVSAFDARVTACERNNEALYTATLELIDLYEKKGFMSVLAQREPVTKLKRTQIENLMDDYRRIADEMRLQH
jgi:chromosome segregation ATPase